MSGVVRSCPERAERDNDKVARILEAAQPALHIAAVKGQKAVIEALLNRGANLEALNKVCTPAGEAAAAHLSRCRAT